MWLGPRQKSSEHGVTGWHLMIEGCLILDDFDSNLLSGVFPQTPHYLAKGTLSKQVPHNVSAEKEAVLCH